MTHNKTPNSVRKKQSLAEPHETISHSSNDYRAIFKSILIGTFILITVVSVLLFISYFVLQNKQVVPRIVPCAIGLLYLAIAYTLWGRGYRYLASRMLIGFYFSIATIVQLFGGINLPFGLLGFAICIVLTGILLGARSVLYATGVSISIIFAMQTYASTIGSSSGEVSSSFGDAIAHSTLLAILGLISWLFGQRTEYLLYKRQQAEQELIKEKKLLEVRVRERTEQLQKAQLDEMEQLYQFAEIGQLSTALLHDLANHLAVLNFDIADLKKRQRSSSLQQIEQSISYLEQAVFQVRKQLQGKNEPRRFSAAHCLRSNIDLIAPKAAEAGITLSLHAPKKVLNVYGDPLRLSHIVNVLIQNAIESYKTAAPESKRIVDITIEAIESSVIIRVRDHGIGVAKSQLKRLFTPLRSTKKDGLGIGLFIARKIAQTHFHGTLTFTDTTDHTEFVIKLPKAP